MEPLILIELVQRGVGSNKFYVSTFELEYVCFHFAFQFCLNLLFYMSFNFT